MTDPERDALRIQLTEHEGLRLRPYTDIVGKLTIGCGRNLTDKGISLAVATEMLEEDIDEAEADLSSFGWFATCGPIRQRALLDLRFNLGPSRFRGFRKMLDACEAGNWPRVVDELLDSHWAYQVQPARRDRLARQLRTGVEA